MPVPSWVAGRAQLHRYRRRSCLGHLQLRLSGTQPDAVFEAANDRHRDTRTLRREVAGMEVYDDRYVLSSLAGVESAANQTLRQKPHTGASAEGQQGRRTCVDDYIVKLFSPDGPTRAHDLLARQQASPRLRVCRASRLPSYGYDRLPYSSTPFLPTTLAL